MNAEEARRKFWDALRDVIEEQQKPIYFTENRQWAIINKGSSNYHSPCVALDFLWRDEFLRINVYIENDIELYDELKERKDSIESALGFACFWKENNTLTNGGKKKFNGENTRRIEVDIQFDKRTIDFNSLAMKALPIIIQYVEVFRGYVDC